MDRLDKTQEVISRAALAKECQDYLQATFDRFRANLWQEMQSEETAVIAYYKLEAMGHIVNMLNADIQGGKKALRKLEVSK